MGREELARGVEEALYLMNQMTRLSEIRENALGKLVRRKANVGDPKMAMRLIAAFAAWMAAGIVCSIVSMVVLNMFGRSDWMPETVQVAYFVLPKILPLVAAAAGFLLYGKVARKRAAANNQQIDEENARIMEYNKGVQRELEAVDGNLRQVQNQYIADIAPWYPPDYCTIDAAEFFLSCFRNFRADTMKEAINLYETTMHQRRLEANQEETHRLLNLNNRLTQTSIFMQQVTLGAIMENTQAINNMGATMSRAADSASRSEDILRDINKKIRR